MYRPRNNISPILLFLSSLALCVQCAHKPVAPRASPTREISPRTETRAVTPKNAELGENISALLALAGLENVRTSVNPETGYVHLFGSVTDAQTRDRLQNAVQSFKGVRQVSSDVTIQAPEPAQPPAARPFGAWPLLAGAFVVALLIAMGLAKSSRRRYREAKTFG